MLQIMMKINGGSVKYFYIVRWSAFIAFVLYCLFPFEALSQPFIKGTYTAKKEFCSSSFLFLPGGLFYYEGGCEERSVYFKGEV